MCLVQVDVGGGGPGCSDFKLYLIQEYCNTTLGAVIRTHVGVGGVGGVQPTWLCTHTPSTECSCAAPVGVGVVGVAEAVAGKQQRLLCAHTCAGAATPPGAHL